jgi:hypothetical protein
MQAQVKAQRVSIERLALELRKIQRQQEETRAQLQSGTQQLDRKIQDVGTVTDSSTQRIGTLESSLGKRTFLLLAGLAAVAFGALGMFVVLRHRSDGIDLRLQEARKHLDQEAVKLDGKLIELLSNQMRATENISLESAPSTPSPSKVDHTLPLRVGEEIQRMRQRLASLPDDTKGLRPLLKSLERLEEDFTKQGYELVELLNKPYSEEMTVKARFIPSNDLNIGERIITRVIKPLILFHGVMVEMPEVEVSTGG